MTKNIIKFEKKTKTLNTKKIILKENGTSLAIKLKTGYQTEN
jgi:hypothetical protein